MAELDRDHVQEEMYKKRNPLRGMMYLPIVSSYWSIDSVPNFVHPKTYGHVKLIGRISECFYVERVQVSTRPMSRFLTKCVTSRNGVTSVTIVADSVDSCRDVTRENKRNVRQL